MNQRRLIKFLLVTAASTLLAFLFVVAIDAEPLWLFKLFLLAFFGILWIVYDRVFEPREPED